MSSSRSGGSTATQPGQIPVEASTIFGARLGLALRYAELLSGAGVTRGLIGPREVPRLWDRHLLNCAVVSELLPIGARVLDVGSGAGLPGLVLAIRRPDLQIVLVESLKRRSDFLTEAIGDLDLQAQVAVVHGRAEEPAVLGSVGGATWVTARAVAPLERLVRWCLPLLRPGGRLLAVKGASAAAEVAEHGAAVRRLGGSRVDIVRCGVDVLANPTTVVVVERTAGAGKKGKP